MQKGFRQGSLLPFEKGKDCPSARNILSHPPSQANAVQRSSRPTHRAVALVPLLQAEQANAEGRKSGIRRTAAARQRQL